jgi:hypothetical protein
MATVFPTVYGADVGALGFFMPAKTTEKANQATWRDWQPPDVPEPTVLLTRDEFLARLQRRGVDVEENDLRYWEYEGILPRAVRQWDPEAKARRAYYPLWMMAPVVALRELRRDGLPLRDILPYLKFAATDAAQGLHGGGITNHKPEDKDKERAIDSWVLSSALAAIWLVAVVPTLRRYVQLLDRIEGKETWSGELVLADADGDERRRAPFSMLDEQGHLRSWRTLTNLGNAD